MTLVMKINKKQTERSEFSKLEDFALQSKLDFRINIVKSEALIYAIS